jgi:hypothetical protein
MKLLATAALAMLAALGFGQVGAKSPITSEGEDASKKGQAHCPL